MSQTLKAYEQLQVRCCIVFDHLKIYYSNAFRNVPRTDFFKAVYEPTLPSSGLNAELHVGYTISI